MLSISHFNRLNAIKTIDYLMMRAAHAASCRGAVPYVMQHGNVWHTATQQNTSEDPPLLRISLHQSEAFWWRAQEAGEPALPYSSCHHSANQVSFQSLQRAHFRVPCKPICSHVTMHLLTMALATSNAMYPAPVAAPIVHLLSSLPQ